MARGINKVILIGNCGSDPELRTTATGEQIASLSLATDESYKDKQTGQVVPKTEWHKLSAFGRTAEIIGSYIRKGSKIYIEGRLRTRKWQDNSGADRYTTEIVVKELQMLDKAADGQGGQASAPQPAQQYQQPAQQYQPQQRQPAPAQQPTARPSPMASNPRQPQYQPQQQPQQQPAQMDDFDDELPF